LTEWRTRFRSGYPVSTHRGVVIPKRELEDERSETMYRFKYVRGEHIEVYLNGIFLFSADSLDEAKNEIAARGDY
jgi:hypothetical protein